MEILKRVDEDGHVVGGILNGLRIANAYELSKQHTRHNDEDFFAPAAPMNDCNYRFFFLLAA